MADPSVEDAVRADEDKSATALIAQTLRNYGLPESLATTLWNEWHVQGGKNASQIILDLPQTKEYKARFPGMEALRKEGTGMTEEGYIQYENGVKQAWQKYGIPHGFRDSPQDIANYLTGHVSVNELENRLQLGATAALQSPVETRYELHRLYGADLGNLTAYFLDTGVGKTLMDKQAALAAANVGGASSRSGFGLLSRAEAESIAKLNPGDNAEKGFDQLNHEKELFEAQDASESAVTREQQLAATFGGEGSGAAQEALGLQQARRKAKFQSGGDFAAGQKGVTGLGTAGQ